MTRRVPVVATLVVALAVATMIALGLWQLRRMDEKAALLATYARSEGSASDVAWPTDPADHESALYRRSAVTCRQVRGIDAVAGRSDKGETGWAHIARCALAEGGAGDVALGWSREPVSPDWSGGRVSGSIGPYGRTIKLVASPAQAGLGQLAAPDPRDVPNNHLSYAVQWFLFALTAMVIYVLALRKRWRSTPA